MPSVPVAVRPAKPTDAAASLLYASAAPYYDRFAGSRADAERVLAALYPRERHTTSWTVCLLAEDAGEVVGVLAGFPVARADALASRFVRLALMRIRPWHLPRTFAHLRAASRIAPVPPVGSWYVDALAVAPHARRRGVATALLAAADQRARDMGARALALDTGLENRGAQRLYEAAGFSERTRVEAPDRRAALALGGRGFVSYVRPLGTA
jgi:ribosomal protein S18 acetylase RimI-like enzyme